MAGQRGKLLSYAARSVLIKSCLASIPIYLLAFFKFTKWALDLINSHMANFLWNDFEGHKKLHLANWKLICKKNEYGGLGTSYLANVNLCLLGSWISRYDRDEGKLWRQMVDSKYNTDKTNIFCSKKTGSPNSGRESCRPLRVWNLDIGGK